MWLKLEIGKDLRGKELDSILPFFILLRLRVCSNSSDLNGIGSSGVIDSLLI